MTPPDATAEVASPARLVHDRYVPFLIASLASALTSGASAFYAERFGIRTTEWRVLSVMADAGAITASEIGLRANLDKAAVSRSLRELEDKVYVATVADTGDARRRLSVLTSDGEALYARVRPAAIEREQALLAPLSAREADRLIGLLQRLRAQALILAGDAA